MTGNINETKEELLIQAVKTQYAILSLLDHTLLETYRYEKALPVEKQNKEIIHLTYQARNMIGKKPKLKEIYKKLEEDHGIMF
ncbi:hypothetical protein D8M04_00320 [Oceanobacillus piezotolerans]|uniref:Uncharacterized protein n=1 Tax=Oceanobacillus piezotolerans TaxID=2448030 RepID=A0A498D901_9BACI|nr:hypothetical protein [Oceanobacillus piezotolerans]RLL47763.1 hypothetical protein D8M04_00320 [Oceanobacillus piezotolerans]